MTDFEWQERKGRLPDGDAFHEWLYVHGSGRVAAIIQGPRDQVGGFSHAVIFMFAQERTMRDAPFMFLDFDGGKRFVEETMADQVAKVTIYGGLCITSDESPLADFPRLMQAAISAIIAKMPPCEAVPVGD